MLDYTQRFNFSREDVMLHFSRPLVLSKHARETHARPGRVINAEKTLIYDADECLAACFYLINSDQTKNGHVAENLNSRRSLEN